eukprot:TRINITY_DN445_c0_g1::TRINITY_DN445_c0_g1_i1::g.2542::m.2542 TRINITY_DN445_c0_g1::TRINITY_DN445_c0_g1_i1::g.2542  ORF type:complete len:714 (+),score=175.16,sp/Q7ZYC4/ACBG2_XENLA/44.44/0.0,AMP-binding/PF00501.23/2.5e-87 TRINITY_DN445_c0_g1_i1:45-2144(+)
MNVYQALSTFLVILVALYFFIFPRYTKKPGKWVKPTADQLASYPKGKHWISDPREDLPIKLARIGHAAQTPLCVMTVLKQATEKSPNVPALSVERGGTWLTWTWAEYYEAVLRAGRAFIHLGLEPFDCVNIIGFNSPEWVIANLGAIAAGGMAAGIYTTNGPDACKFISEHSEAKVVVVEDEIQLEKFLKIRSQLPRLKTIVQWGGKVPASANVPGQAPVLSWTEFMALADEVPQSKVEARIAAQKPNQCCTLIYTSGTTGNPKAVMLSHDNITWITTSVLSFAPDWFGRKDEHIVSYLPLSHVAAQLLDIYAPLIITAFRPGHCTLHFARPDALKGSLGVTLKQVRPTFFFGVPRVWEKIQEKLLEVGSKTKGIKRKIVDWAKAEGMAAAKDEEVGGSGRKGLGFYVAKWLLLDRIHEAMGLDRCLHAASGAAPISKDTVNYFSCLYLHIKELYGMSESTGPVTSCTFDIQRPGSCGVALPGCEIKIDHLPGRDKPNEGEVCFRGRNIMLGYMKSPEKTREAIDDEGWLHSGDVGRLDENGLLHITGRIKELIITAGGENIAPVPIEDRIKEVLPGVSNVMMVGDRQKYNVALVTLQSAADEHGACTDALAGKALEISSVRTVSAAVHDDAWNKYVAAGISKYNKEAVSNAQRIQKFRILPRDFSVHTGELTATLKLRRPVVAELYASIIAEMYEGSD